jgi:hypothetical protein
MMGRKNKKIRQYKEAESFDTGQYLYAFLHLHCDKHGKPRCTKCQRPMSEMTGKEVWLGKFWVTHLICECGEHALRIVGAGSKYETPWADDDEE